MNPTNRSAPLLWRQSRYGLAAFYGLMLLCGWSLLRLFLFCACKPAHVPPATALEVMAAGFQRDLFAALAETLPLLFWFWLLSERAFRARWHRLLFGLATALVGALQSFLLFAEYFFFDEFKSRFNTVAVDYLIYPREVFINIWESYHVGLILALCATAGLFWWWVCSRLFGRMWERPFRPQTRLAHLLGALALVLGLALTLNLKSSSVCDDRTLNEVANNGPLSFVSAAWTRNLDYSAFYSTLPRQEAFLRVRARLTETNCTLETTPLSIRRQVAGNPARPRLNVLLFLEESFGSEFWGCLGRSNSLTPHMDRLALQEGLLFTNIFACGNRTVRGMEGVLASFPPLPGDSIVKRDRSDNVETLARVLQRDGYSTLFLYGGRGLFDGMRSFALRNGYERFIEQKHFAHPAFTTIWGVCDEDLYDRTLSECHQMAASGKPFFATVLTVSNHKPYTYPPGRIPEDPQKKRRDYVVKYTDYALGRFFSQVRQEPFWTNTIFVVVADHGARVYGKQAIPIHSYEIPLVILGPAVVPAPAQLGQLGNSLDVAPTILGLLGRPYESLFFGRDLLHSSQQGRALLNHNRDIGLLCDQRMVVLGLQKTREFYQGNPKSGEMRLQTTLPPDCQELDKDAAALFQVADELYMHRLYHLDVAPDRLKAAAR